ncbi:MAG: hypothetical protein QOF35_1922, partial [Actinomycetota bacterium]|nr:hypothetical protein [Actinomycetota bacterium]
GLARRPANSSLAAPLTAVTSDLDATIRDIRGTIFELQRQRGGSLRAELRGLVREYAAVLGHTPHVRTSGPVDSVVPDRVREQLLPVLREALSNITRHAHATHAEVIVQVTPHQLSLTVLDDGVGLAPELNQSGLRNARRRATNLGGTLALEARDPRGTTLTWCVPLA